MDDCCAVCAEPLEWVAYGSCGHREVCSTCVVRLRFILLDNRCCICKTESPSVFVTRAMGDYTRVISDFATLPSGAREGQAGSFWYHEKSQAYFDDVDHYQMIKAMCKLSCSVCDKNSEEQAGEFVKRKYKFRSIEQLKGHLYHEHKLHMCNVCLKGRKVFISEQKLYTRPQLNQHIITGDSEADGSESERGGFTGHPMCHFCRIPFYGDNELYMHNSTEHYTCHICQRQHPDQYDYFRNYDGLEIHYRDEHFLCEDEACLAKKFIVFASESEMKRHNAVEHGGNMSRAKRNAALQLPTSFRYQSSQQDNRRGRGRGRGFRPDPSNDHLAQAIQAIQSNESSYIRDSYSSDPPTTESRESAPSAPETSSDSNSHILESSYFPPLSDRDPPETSSRYVPPFSQMNAAKLRGELFPPLPSTKAIEIPGNNSTTTSSSTPNNTLASRLNKGKGKVKVINPHHQKESRSSNPDPSSFPQLNKHITQNQAPPPPPGNSVEITSSSSTLASRLSKGNSVNVVNPPRPKESRAPNPDPSSFPQLRPATQNQAPAPGIGMESPGNNTFTSSTLASRLSKGKGAGVVNPPRSKDARSLSPNLSSFPELKSTVQNQAPTTSTSGCNANRMSHSSSAPNLKAGEDDRGANKVLVEKILTALGNDEEKYAAFMSISSEYSSGQINVWEFLSYVEQFGLMNLVFVLGGLYPEKEKKFELFDAYNTTIRTRNSQGKDSVKHRKAKGKGINAVDKDSMADKFVETVKELQLNQKQQENAEVEVLSKDGYRNSSSSKVNLNASFGEESSRKGRKASTFLKNRGLSADTSAIEDDVRNFSLERGREEKNIGQSSGSVVKGAWKNNGGRKLM